MHFKQAAIAGTARNAPHCTSCHLFTSYSSSLPSSTPSQTLEMEPFHTCMYQLQLWHFKYRHYFTTISVLLQDAWYGHNSPVRSSDWPLRTAAEVHKASGASKWGHGRDGWLFITSYPGFRHCQSSHLFPLQLLLALDLRTSSPQARLPLT